MKKTIWIATYVNDKVADDYGSEVFDTEDEALAFTEDYVDDDDRDKPTKFASYRAHEVDLT